MYCCIVLIIYLQHIPKNTFRTDVFLTEPHQPHKNNREKIVETMFELFDVGATYLHVQPVLALFATGLTTVSEQIAIF